MKKLFIISILALLISGCTCIMSQSLPPQFLQVGEGCGVAMPDLRPLLHWTDNCGIDTVEQTPTPGSWLTAKYNTVRIRAIDNFANFTDIMGPVELIDTVPPSLVGIDSTLISNVYEKIDAIYNIADRMLAETDLWTTAQLPDSLNIWEDYYNNVLVSYTDPGHAFTGEGMRVWVFGEVGDTIIIR